MKILALGALSGCSFAVAAAGGYRVPDPAPAADLGCDYAGPPTVDAFVGILFGALATGLGIGLVERSGPPRNTVDLEEVGLVWMTAIAVPYLASAATGYHLLHRCHEAGERARAGRS